MSTQVITRTRRRRLAIVSTHPIQYLAPLYIELHRRNEFDLVVFFATDFGQQPSQDAGFNHKFKWDVPLLEGYPFKVLNFYGKNLPLELAPEKVKTTIGSELKAGDFDAVVISGYMAKVEREAVLAALFQRIPILFRPEGNDECKDRSLAKRLIRSLVLFFFYKLIFRFLSIGKISENHFFAHGGSQKNLIHTPYCVDNGFFERARAGLPSKESLRREVGLGDCSYVLMYCGKITLAKNWMVLPVILAALGDRLNLGLIVVGSGVMQDKLLQEVSSIKNAQFHFAGFQNQSQLSRYYGMADALILPSSFGETWGLVVNEGMNFGLPAIVSNKVGCRLDLVTPGETGAIFDLERPLSAIDAVVDVFESKEKLALLSGNACARIKMYSIARCADGITAAVKQSDVARDEV